MGDIVYRCIDSWPDRKLAHMYSYLAWKERMAHIAHR
jgi:hypothetical protein